MSSSLCRMSSNEDSISIRMVESRIPLSGGTADAQLSKCCG